MGRPKLPPDERRDVIMQIRMHAGEKARIEAQAQQLGLSGSEYARRALSGTRLPARDEDRRARAALTTALLRLGVNLNQIAHHMNAGRSAPRHLPDLIADIRRHVDRLSVDESGQDRHG